MSRFYVPKEAVKGKLITITGDEAHHILDVMRLKALDKVVSFDGTGKEYTGFIKDVKSRSLTVEIVETRDIPKRALAAITLIQAIPKKDKMDYIVEKATELGVHSIIPVITERTIPAWDDRKKDMQVERWRRIARNASKQCGRTNVPDIGKIQHFKDIVRHCEEPQATKQSRRLRAERSNLKKDCFGPSDLAMTVQTYELKLIAALSDESMQLKSALAGFTGKSLAVAIGPEGDFTDGEVKAAGNAGFKLINLGERVLKSDTAGLALLAILNYEFSKG